jgi:pantothenate kinase
MMDSPTKFEASWRKDTVIYQGKNKACPMSSCGLLSPVDQDQVGVDVPKNSFWVSQWCSSLRLIFLFCFAGKSTVSTAVAERLNKDKEIAIVVPMDGWHLTQKDLLDQYGEEQGMRRRGAPWTFDAAKICKDLAKAKMEREGTFPIYCRDISDPVEDGVQLKKTHQVIIVEGLYILWKEDEEWGQLCDLFDERWFIKVPSREEQIRRLVQRSKHNWTPDKEERWGAYPDGARNRAEFNDVKNMDLVSGCEKHADEVIISQSP